MLGSRYYENVGDDAASKSVTIIYSKDESSYKEPKFARNSIGKRQAGDELLYFQTRNVTNVSRFPSKSFEYTGNHYITYVGFSFSVSFFFFQFTHFCYNSMVFFQSPTAMVLLNSTYISEKEFDAVIYDLNSEHFIANISVYGMRQLPEKCLGVLSVL